ncbi:MAG: hypothetical protein GF401_04740 [Chitinivibrionales bacterium]|nr:hypothetical protein [Chitinivibrionales bacterium]
MKSYHQALETVSGSVDSFFKKAFDTVCINRPSIDFSTLKDKPIMIASSHRSQADYFLIGSLLNRMGIDNLRFAAGDNLTNLPIIGDKFKQWGAFPVERHRANNRSYILTLCNQVSSMLEQDDNVIVFPEMGRSYSGKMLEMKQVIIGAAVLAQARNPEKTYLYLPCSISYEQLPELEYFDTLLKGKKMRAQENSFFKKAMGNINYFGADAVAFSKFIFAHRFGKRYGSVYVDVGEPVAINDIVDLKALHNPKASNEFWANRTAMKKISIEIYNRLLALYRIFPASIVAHIMNDHRAMKLSEIKPQISSVIEKLQAKKRNLQTIESLSEDDIIEDGIRVLSRMSAVKLRNMQAVIRKQFAVKYYAALLNVD